MTFSISAYQKLGISGKKHRELHGTLDGTALVTQLKLKPAGHPAPPGWVIHYYERKVLGLPSFGQRGPLKLLPVQTLHDDKAELLFFRQIILLIRFVDLLFFSDEIATIRCGTATSNEMRSVSARNLLISLLIALLSGVGVRRRVRI